MRLMDLGSEKLQAKIEGKSRPKLTSKAKNHQKFALKKQKVLERGEYIKN